MPGQPDDRFRALQQSVFGALPEVELHRLAEEAHESRLRAGHLLYDAEVSIVIAGFMRAYIAAGDGRQVTFAYGHPGDTLALAHLAGRRYPTAFQAITDSRLVTVGNDLTRELYANHPALGWAMTQELAARLDDFQRELAYFAFGSLLQRLAYHLLALTAASNDFSSQPVHLAHLANAVGTSREMVSRTLAPLAANGVLHTGIAGVVVTDRRRLQDEANVD